MSTLLPTGGNTTLQQTQYTANFTWTGTERVREGLAVVALLVGQDGKVMGDEGVIGIDHTSHPSHAVRIKGTQVEIDISQLPPNTDKIILAVGVREGSLALLELSPLETLTLSLLGPHGTDEIVIETPLQNRQIRASASCELYIKNGVWKVRALSQGYDDGIPALSARYGLALAEAARVTGMATDRPLDRPTLSGGQVIQLDPRQSIPDFQIELTWAPLPPQDLQTLDDPTPQPKGLFKSLLGSSKKQKTLDLDLCCLFELSDGYRGIVQSLGDHYGSYSVAPFMELMGDSRGGATESETSKFAIEKIRVNGKKFPELRRAIFYAMIFEGAPDWSRAAGRMTLRIPDQVPISARLDGSSGRACSALMIENIDGHLVVHKCVETFKTPHDLDRHFGWGLAWASGTKD